MNPGFDPCNVVATMVTLDPRFFQALSVDRIGEDVLERLKALPGVEHTALSGLLPLEGFSNNCLSRS